MEDPDLNAICFLGANQSADITDVPEPRPGHGKVVVAVEAVGLCHSDQQILDGSFPVPAPMTVGHEIAGRVLEVAAGVDTRQWLAAALSDAMTLEPHLKQRQLPAETEWRRTLRRWINAASNGSPNSAVQVTPQVLAGGDSVRNTGPI
jgi:hypothetical protein